MFKNLESTEILIMDRYLTTSVQAEPAKYENPIKGDIIANNIIFCKNNVATRKGQKEIVILVLGSYCPGILHKEGDVR